MAIAVLSCVAFSALGRAGAQQSDAKVLVGTLDSAKKEQHAYAIDASIVNQAYRADSPLVARIFVGATTKQDCCSPAEKLSPTCWKCCDGHYITTDSEAYNKLLQEIPRVSEAEWVTAKNKNFYDVPHWLEIANALAASPPRDIPASDPRFKLIPWDQIKQ